MRSVNRSLMSLAAATALLVSAGFTPANATPGAGNSADSRGAASALSTERQDGVTVLDSGSISLTPKLDAKTKTAECIDARNCEPESIQGGLLDNTSVDRSTTTTPSLEGQKWYAADQAVIHVDQREDGYTVPQMVSGNTIWPGLNVAGPDGVTDTGIHASDYVDQPAPNDLLLGFYGGADERATPNSDFGQALARNKSKTVLSRIDDAPGVMKMWSTSFNERQNLWDSSLPEDQQQARPITWKGPFNSPVAWEFSKPGVYCPVITSTVQTKLGTKLSTKTAYTIVVGDTVDPASVTPCEQPENDDEDGPSGPRPRVVTDSAHHDVRLYRHDKTFTFGMDKGETPLKNLIWANTPAPTTVQKPTQGKDMRAVGPVGTKYWYFPYSSGEGSPWPGISAESLDSSEYSGQVSFSLQGFSRDGIANPSDTDVAMFSSTSSNRTSSYFNTRLGARTTTDLAPKTHFHPYWTFTKPGLYCLAVGADAHLKDGTPVTGTGQITMVVGTQAEGAPDPETVTPCEANGKPAPVADYSPTLHPQDADKAYHVKSTEDAYWDIARKGKDLDSMATTTDSVDNEPAGRDANDLILSATTYWEENESWTNRGSGGSNLAVNLAGLPKEDLKGGMATLSLGKVKGPGTFQLGYSSNWGGDTVLSSAKDGPTSWRLNGSSLTADGHGLWTYFSKPGVYCVPLEVKADFKDGGSGSVSKTLTFVAGNTSDPKEPDYIDPSTVTTCSRGQEAGPIPDSGDNGNADTNGSGDHGGGADGGSNGSATGGSDGASDGSGNSSGAADGGSTPNQPGADPTVSHDDVFVKNGTKTTSGATILNKGHVDVASKLAGSTLQSWVKDTTETSEALWHGMTGSSSMKSKENKGKGVVFQVLPGAKTKVPNNPAYAFLGDTGDPIWQLPEVQDQSLLWPGWSTESIPASDLKTGVKWRLDDVQGPGEFALYQSTTAGTPLVRFNTRDGVDSKDSFTIEKNAHVHASWAFSKEGTYCLASTRSTTLTNGKQASDKFTLAIAVGHVDVKRVDPSKCFTGKPASKDTKPVNESQLTADTQGGVRVQNATKGFNPGQQVTVNVPKTYTGKHVSFWLHSDPIWMGWTDSPVAADGSVKTRLPSNASLGGHKLVVTDGKGKLIGWDTVDLHQASTPPPGGGDDGNNGGGNGGKDPGEGKNPGDGSHSDTTGLGQCKATPTTVISSGHLDYNTQVKNGKLHSLIGDNSSGTEVFREPSRTVLWLKPASRLSLPAGYGKIGKQGSKVYMVPQTQDMNLIWLGWSTERLKASQVFSPVSWKLNGVKGPGSMKVFLNGSFGDVGKVVFDSTTKSGNTLKVNPNVHAHANWAFSKQGIYRINFTQSVKLANGKTVKDTEVLTIAVGNVDPASAVDGGKDCIKQTPGVTAAANGDGNQPNGTGTPVGKNTNPNAVCTPVKTRVISAGHLDWNTQVVGGKLESLIGDDSTGTRVYRDPASTVLWLKPQSKTKIPAAFSSIGNPGSTVWQVPQTQDPNLIWLGWSTELLNKSNTKSSVKWTVDKVDGPGTMKIFTTGSFGGVEEKVFAGTGTYTVQQGVHAHANWAFSKEGVYKLHMTQSATLANGKRSSDSEVLTLAVGNVDPTHALDQGDGCGNVPASALDGKDDEGGSNGGLTAGGYDSDDDQTLDNALKAAEQAQAKADRNQASLLPGIKPVAAALAPETPGLVAAVAKSPAKALLGGLSGLALAGAAGTGLLWWRRRGA